jgi:hypothetical protein
MTGRGKQLLIFIFKKGGLIKSAPLFDDLFITDHSWLIAYV